MEVTKAKKIKPSQKILYFLRNERDKGRETFVIHRSDQGMKEIDLRLGSSENKNMEKTSLQDGVLDEDEFEDLGKVYEQVKKYIEVKNHSQFKPAQDEMRKFNEVMFQEKTKKSGKNTLNWQANCKRIRQSQIRSKLEIQQKKKRMNYMSTMMQDDDELELRPRDARLLAHLHEPYEKNVDSINVNLKISQYNKNKVIIEKGCEALQRECVSALKHELASQATKGGDDMYSTQETFFPLRTEGGRERDQVFAIDEIISKQRSQFNKMLDLRSYNIAEKAVFDKRAEISHSALFQKTRPVSSFQKERISSKSICVMTEQGKNKRQISQEKIQSPEKMYTEGDTYRKTQKRCATACSDSRARSVTETDQGKGKEVHHFERKNIISMVTGKPMKPYLQLDSLAEKIEARGKDRKSRERTKHYDEHTLKGIEEFKNFSFQTDLKQISTQHSNLATAMNFVGNGTMNHLFSGFTAGTNYTAQQQNNTNPIIAIIGSGAGSGSGNGNGNVMPVPMIENGSNSSQIDGSQTDIKQNQPKRMSGLLATNKVMTQLTRLKSTNSPNREESKSENISIFQENSLVQSGNSNQPSATKKRVSNVLSNHSGVRKTEQSTPSRHMKTKGESSTEALPNRQFNEPEFFSINSRLIKSSKIKNKLQQIRSENGVEIGNWEEMKQLEEEVQRCENLEERREIRKKLSQIGKKNYNTLKEKHFEEEEQRAIKFNQLVRQTESLENKLMNQFEEVKKTKHRMNEEFKGLIETFQRDRSLTRSIRKRNYNKPEDQSFSQVKGLTSATLPTEIETKPADSSKREKSLQEMRVKSEQERRRMLTKNTSIAEWYTNSVNKLASLASNGEDMSICHLIMDLIKSLLEDGLSPDEQHVHRLLEYIESQRQFQYNQNSIYCFNLVFNLLNMNPKEQTMYRKFTYELKKKQ